MGKTIILATRNKEEAEQIRAILAGNAYTTTITAGLEELGNTLKSDVCTAALLDLDSISIDNRRFRHLALEHKRTGFLCMSQKRAHPELKEAISHYFYACLTKPLDFDELLYWLRCIEDNEPDTAARNGTKTH